MGVGVLPSDPDRIAFLYVHRPGEAPALWAALTILVELVGPLLILLDRALWLGAGALGVFTVLAALIANDFWTMAGSERFMATNAFFEHIGLVGGFVLAAIISRMRRRLGPND